MQSFILLLLTTLADHLTVATLFGYIQFLFEDREDPLVTQTLMMGSLSFFLSGLGLGWLLDKFGSRHFKLLVLGNLVLNGSAILSLIFVPTVAGNPLRYLWLPLRLLANLLTSELYVPYYVENRFASDATKSLANSSNHFCNFLASLLSVIFVMAGFDFDKAIITVTAFSAFTTGLVLIFFENDGSSSNGQATSKDRSDKKVTFDGLSPQKAGLNNIVPRPYSSSTSSLIATSSTSSTASSISSKASAPASSSMKQRNRLDKILLQLIKDPYWILLTLFMMFKQLLSGLIYINIAFQTAVDHSIDEKGVGLVRLITTIVSMLLGPSLVFFYSRTKVKSHIQLIVSCMVMGLIMALYHFVQIHYQSTVALVAVYAIFDFASNPSTIALVSDYALLYPKRLRGKIVSLTLSAAQLGNVVGVFLSQDQDNALAIKMGLSTTFTALSILLFKVSRKTRGA